MCRMKAVGLCEFHGRGIGSKRVTRKILKTGELWSENWYVLDSERSGPRIRWAVRTGPECALELIVVKEVGHWTEGRWSAVGGQCRPLHQGARNPAVFDQTFAGCISP